MKKKNKWIAALMCAVLALSLLTGCQAVAPAAQSASPEASMPVSEEPSATPGPEETAAEPVELYISAAASLTDALNEIQELYALAAPDVTLTITYASSGNLQTQIEEGAPADVFISAAQKQMNALEDGSLIQNDTRIDLLENKVVLIVPAGSDAGIAGFEDAATGKAAKVAIGDPDSVPAGQYAREVFTSLGIYDAVSAKAVLGSDVRQVLNWIETGDADCGVVYATDAATSDGVTVVTEAPEGSVSPIIYPAAVLAGSENTGTAQAFLAYLQGGEAAAVFEAYGFSMA